MDQNNTAPDPTVPVRNDAPNEAPRRSLFARTAAEGPVALIFAGLGVTVLWLGFLGWCAFGVLRWVLG